MQALLYDHPAWLDIPDQVIRPGGLTITEQALAFCDLRPGARVLDVGCGAGTTLRHVTSKCDLAGFGVDISMQLLSRAHGDSSKVSFAQAKGEYLPFADESLDAIISECTLSIFKSDVALNECARALKHGGYLMINDLYARNENGVKALSQLLSGICIDEVMSQKQILEKIKHCGLEIFVWQDCSEKLKEFSVYTLSTVASDINPLDLFIAAAKAKLGYYFLAAQKTK
jgi:arsenite methyltransferase